MVKDIYFKAFIACCACHRDRGCGFGCESGVCQNYDRGRRVGCDHDRGPYDHSRGHCTGLGRGGRGRTPFPGLARARAHDPDLVHGLDRSLHHDFQMNEGAKRHGDNWGGSAAENLREILMREDKQAGPCTPAPFCARDRSRGAAFLPSDWQRGAPNPPN